MNGKQKLPAFSILESVVALMLIVLALGLATRFFIQTVQSDQSRETTILLELKALAIEEKEKAIHENQRLEFESFVAELNYLPYAESERLEVLRIVAIDLNQKEEITSWEEIVVKK